MINCKDNTIYTGITIDVNERMKTHAKGEGAKYTRGRGPFKLLGVWKVKTKSEALKVEYFIKSFPKNKKMKFISDDIHLKSLILKEKEIEINRVEIMNFDY
jgi:putative endonuclease